MRVIAVARGRRRVRRHRTNLNPTGGQNLPISPDVISRIFGGQLQSMGDRLGLDSQEAAGGLASLLPELVDKATPNGRLEGDRMQGDQLGAWLDSVRGALTR